jgi:hypothetical protein
MCHDIAQTEGFQPLVCHVSRYSTEGFQPLVCYAVLTPAVPCCRFDRYLDQVFDVPEEDDPYYEELNEAVEWGWDNDNVSGNRDNDNVSAQVETGTMGQ